jgi:hypothetical protein
MRIVIYGEENLNRMDMRVKGEGFTTGEGFAQAIGKGCHIQQDGIKVIDCDITGEWNRVQSGAAKS